ncbi:hypothetical protein C8J56DRAFT_1056792 [Mycena floridula]|nr:hypothetical protein C8J56DRAFT_1056792 [Mycena floridula]
MSSAGNDNLVPLKAARLIALSLSFIWGLVPVGGAVNALQQSKQDVGGIASLPKAVSLEINVSDIISTLALVIITSVVIGIVSALYIISILVPRLRRLSTRVLPVEWATMHSLHSFYSRSRQLSR